MQIRKASETLIETYKENNSVELRESSSRTSSAGVSSVADSFERIGRRSTDYSHSRCSLESGRSPRIDECIKTQFENLKIAEFMLLLSILALYCKAYDDASDTGTSGEITDGSSNTIQIGEITDGSSNTIQVGESPSAPRTSRDIRDGSSNTIQIGEIADGSSNTIQIGESPAASEYSDNGYIGILRMFLRA